MYPTALFFALFGESLIVLRIVAFLVSLLSMYVFYRLVSFFLDEPALGFAMFAYAIPGATFGAWLTHAVMNHGFTHLFTLLLFLLAASHAHRPTRLKWVLAGLLSGVAVWTYFLAAPAVIVTFAIMFWISSRRARIETPFWFGLPFLLGVLPVVIDFARYGGIPPMSFTSQLPGVDGIATLPGRMKSFLINVVPDMASFPLRQEPVKFDFLARVQILTFLAALIAGIVCSLKLLRKWNREGRLRNPSSVAFFGLALHFLFFLVIYVTSGYGGEPYHRFLMQLFPLLFVFYGWLFAWIATKTSRLAAILPLGIFAVGNCLATYDLIADIGQAHSFYVRAETIAQLADYLGQEGYRYVYTDHWVSYLLTFHTKERIIASSHAGPIFAPRYPAYEESVAAADKVAYALYHSLPIHWSESFEENLQRLGISYRRHRIGVLDVYTHFSRRFSIEEIRFPKLIEGITGTPILIGEHCRLHPY
jgi:hypothetical protein